MTTRSLPLTQSLRTATQRGTTWLDWLRRVLHAAESRRELVRMDARMLSDIGISRAEALHEAARAPWDLSQPQR